MAQRHKTESCATEDFQDCVDRAVLELHRARNLLLEEIRTYPTPISGCDAQFNHLLSMRTQIAGALDSLNKTVFIPTPRTLSQAGAIKRR